MNVQFLRRPVGGSRLVGDYLSGTGSASQFYRGAPGDAAGFRAKAEELDAFPADRRASLGDLVRPAGPRGAALLDEAVQPGGYFVTTGQQPGLFGGPLYSLYKALTAVRLAEELSGLLSAPVMPLFWIASDDHDWEEANHTYLIDGANDLRKLSLGPHQDPIRRSLCLTPLGATVSGLVDELERILPASDWGAEYIRVIRENYRPETSASDAFVGLLRSLLSETPIGFVDSAEPALKAASVPLLARELESAELGEQTLLATTASLEEAGYKAQVVLRPRGVNVFVGTEQGRLRVFREGQGFRLGPTGQVVRGAELMGRLRDEPADFSPNVLLRPVLESYLIPTLTYVGGPGELAYFGQLRNFFQHHGVGAPIASPRASFDVAEPKTLKTLNKFGLAPADIEDVDRLLSQRARDALPPEVVQALERWRGTIGGLSEELAAAAARVDPTLEGATQRARNSSYAALTRLEKKLIRAVKRQNETMARQLRGAQGRLWPAGKPQDRILNPLHFLSRFGPDFLEGAVREIQVELGVETG